MGLQNTFTIVDWKVLLYGRIYFFQKKKTNKQANKNNKKLKTGSKRHIQHHLHGLASILRSQGQLFRPFLAGNCKVVLEWQAYWLSSSLQPSTAKSV